MFINSHSISVCRVALCSGCQPASSGETEIPRDRRCSDAIDSERAAFRTCDGACTVVAVGTAPTGWQSRRAASESSASGSSFGS
jgi:hypothetical protein